LLSLCQTGRAGLARILVVEDNDPVRWTLAALLRANGYEVDQAANGEQALLHFADQPTDVVLMDVHMPVMDGLEACQRLRQASQVPILMISTFDNAAIQEQVRDCGANAFIPKPLEFDALLGWVRQMSEGGGGSAPPTDPKPRPRRRRSPRPSPPKPTKPAPGQGLMFSGIAVGTSPAPCRFMCRVPRLQAVQRAENFDLSPPFEYTIFHGA
jgi:CheY-like chemotaxis protein